MPVGSLFVENILKLWDDYLHKFSTKVEKEPCLKEVQHDLLCQYLKDDIFLLKLGNMAKEQLAFGFI